MTEDPDFGLDPGDAHWFLVHGVVASALAESGASLGDDRGQHVANLLANGVLAALERAGLSVVAGDDSEED